MPIDTTRPKRLDKRRKRLSVSYQQVADAIGKHHSTVLRVLQEKQSGITINREQIMDDIERYLDRIE